MKKYKVHFSVFNLFDETQAEVVRMQQWAKGLMAIVIGSTWYASSANAALIVGLGGYVVDALIGMIYLEKKDVQNES